MIINNNSNDTNKYLILKRLYRLATDSYDYDYDNNKPIVLNECEIINSLIQKQISAKNNINLTIGNDTIGFILNIPYTDTDKDIDTDNPYIGPKLYSLYNTKIKVHTDKEYYALHILYNMKNNYTEIILENKNNPISTQSLSYIDTKNTLIDNNVLDNLFHMYIDSTQETVNADIPNDFSFKKLVLGTNLILKVSTDKDRNLYKHYDMEYSDNTGILDIYITDTKYTHIIEISPIAKNNNKYSILSPCIYNLKLLDKYNTDPNYKGISLFIGKVLMDSLMTPYIKYGNLNKQYLSLMKI